MGWEKLDLSAAVLSNVEETALRQGDAAALENAYIGDAGNLTRFPGLTRVVDLGGSDPVVLHKWRDDLIAVTRGGQVYRVSQSLTAENVTGVPVTGGGRCTFAATEFELLMAAGGPIVRLTEEKTTELSAEAPQSTHVAFIAGYVIAIEPRSGRFYHSAVGDYGSWNPLDVFSAEGKPDNLTACVVTPFAELLLIGPESIEQFEPVSGADQPFFRRWMVGSGVFAPDTVVTSQSGTWAVTDQQQWARIGGQTAHSTSDDIQRSLEAIDDWSEAWAAEIGIAGQRFSLLQIPHATNAYGTKGVTLSYDFKKDRWFSLYGWDGEAGLPARWPGWSYAECWGRKFVGGEGCIYELDTGSYANDDQPQRWLWRGGNIVSTAEWHMLINNLRIRMRRGVAGGVLRIRCARDGMPFGRYKDVSLGRPGDRHMTVQAGGFGSANSFQFELSGTDRAPVDIAEIHIDV